MQYRIGVDIGGTFTDFLVLDELGNILGFKESFSEKSEETANHIKRVLQICSFSRQVSYS